jgi:glucose/mannose transport system substrate-binding protein
MRQYFASACLAVILAAFAFGACAPAPEPPSPTPPPSATPTSTLAPPPVPPTATVPATTVPFLLQTPSEPVALQVYARWTQGTVDGHYMGELMKRFQQDRPYISLVDVSTSERSAEIGIVSGQAPDAFYVNINRDLFTDWVSAGWMAPLDDVYEHDGLMQALPQGLVDQVTFQDHVWSMPISIARSNMLWYNKSILQSNDIKPADLQTFDGWEAAAKKLQAVGITPLTLGNPQPWVTWQIFESVLAGTLGPEKYAGLWTGATDWTGPDVGQALQNFAMMLRYSNPNRARIEWDQAYPMLIQRQAAMFVMGDWMVREFSNSAFGDYGWTTMPGTADTFIIWPDAFSLPGATQHPDVSKELMAYLGTREAQEYFNRNRGSGAICPRTDCDYSKFGAYSQASAADFRTDRIVPSIARAMYASESWTAGFATAMTDYLQSGNMAAAQSDLNSACLAAKICQ